MLLFSHPRQMRPVAVVLCVLALIVFSPSLAFGQVLDAEGADLLGNLLAAAGSDPTSPLAAGALLFFVVYLATRAPLTSKLLASVLTTDARKRAFSLAAAMLPGLATVLTGHMSWTKALGTALISWAVSQAIFFLSKKPAAAAPLVALFFFAASSVACTGKQIEQLRTAVEAARDVAVIAEPCAAESRKVLMDGCNGDKACEAKVEEAYRPIKLALNAFHDAWCSLSPESEGC